MSIVITDTIQTIKYVDSANNVEHFYTKNNTQIRVKGDEVQIIEDEFSSTFLFTQVSTPTSSSASDLLDQLNAFINTNP